MSYGEVLYSRQLTDYEIDPTIDDNSFFDFELGYYRSGWSVDLADYIERDKIEKAFKVEVSIEFDPDKDIEIDDFALIVVKYGDEWKVFTFFDI